MRKILVEFLTNEAGPTKVEIAVFLALFAIICVVAVYAIGQGNGTGIYTGENLGAVGGS